MARIEKTVFISYRRTDVYTALAVYENLKNQGYDVFFDYRSISSGDFEQIITSNIRARAHFLLILTPTALDRCNEPGDWLRREIEIAIDEKRNIVPLFFKGFRFGDPSVSEKLTGKLKNLSRYNGLNVHEDYFDEAMERVRKQYLNIPLSTVLHPVSTEVQKVVRAEQVAADKALEKIEDVKELVKRPKAEPKREVSVPSDVADSHPLPTSSSFNFRLVGGIAGGVLLLALLIWGAVELFQNQSSVNPNPTSTSQIVITQTSQTLTTDTPSLIETIVPPTPTLKALGTPIPTSSLIIGSTEPAGTPVPISTLNIGLKMTGKDGMTLLYVPAGKFTMGNKAEDALAGCRKFRSDCQLDWFKDEEPPHTVELDTFWIDQTEVTNAMYAKCVADGKCNPPSSTKSYRRDNYYGNPKFDNYPVIYVSWNDATAYCSWAERRLPTEAEWEKAASWDAKDQTKYVFPWGNNAPNNNLLNYIWATGSTTEVGKYPNSASPYGALDMAGNVQEWLADWYDANYYATLGENASNPQGPASGQDRAQRGGAWSIWGSDVRSANRGRDNPADTDLDIGFRCAMSATP